MQANLDTPERLVFGHIIMTADILQDTPCVVFNADNQSHWQVHQHINEYKTLGEFIIPGDSDGCAPACSQPSHFKLHASSELNDIVSKVPAAV